MPVQPSATNSVQPIRTFALALLTLAALIGATGDAAGQEKRPIQANDLYRIRTARDLAFSPDGKLLAFVVTQIDSAANAYYSHIWLASTDGKELRQVSRGEVRDRNPVWSPDGSKIAFVSSRGDDPSQIHILPIGGGEAWKLTDVEAGASNPVWAPDGKSLLFSSELTTSELKAEAAGGPRVIASRAAATDGDPEASPDTAMWGSLEAIRQWLAKNAEEEDPAVITRLRFQGEKKLDPIEGWSHIYTIDLESKEHQRLTDGSFNFNSHTISPDGRRLAFTAVIVEGVHPDFVWKSDLYVMEADGRDRRLIDVPGLSVTSALWSPDGSSIAFTARDTAELTAANTELGVVELPGGGDASEVIWLSRGLDRGVRGYQWSPDGKSIYFTARVHGTVPIYRVTLKKGEVRQIVSGERGVLDFALSEKALAYVLTEPANPAEVYKADSDGDDERRLTQLNSKWLDSVQVQPHQGFWYPSFDGHRVQAWLIEPVGYHPEEKYPLALEIHGGPHSMWGPGEATMWHEFQFLAANGYFVLYTNPRGSGGYGYEFKYAIQRDWGQGPMKDVLTAVDSVVARGLVAEDRMVVTGGSYAGYLTAYLVGHDHRFKAAVAQRGVYDLATFFGEGNAWRLIPFEFDAYPWEDFEELRAESPITYAHHIRTPLLIMHADHDLRTGVSQSEMLYRTLRVLHKPVEYVRYPREGHDLSRTGEPKHRIDRLLRILEFFERHIKR